MFDSCIFSSRVPSRHRAKHINWKEMFAILHAFILWHKEWAHGRVHIACDNFAVVYGINNRSIKGLAIGPLRTILLIAAVFNIEISSFWIPTEKNIVADAASRHDFVKLANLGFKDQMLAFWHGPSPAIKLSKLRQQLSDFFTLRLPQQHDEITNLFAGSMKHSALPVSIFPSQQQSHRLPIGLHPTSLRRSSRLRSKPT